MIEADFLNFLNSLGLTPHGDLIVGRIARADVINKKNGAKDGAYYLNLDGNGKGWGWAENHQSGSGVVKWSSQTKPFIREAASDVGLQLICGDVALLEERQKFAAARTRALRIYNAGNYCTWDHPYFANKRFTKAIEPLLANLRVGKWTKNGKTKKNCILVPIHDTARILHSIQAIDEGGEKDLLYGGKKGGHFFALKEFRGGKAVILCEGLATGLSIQLETDIPVLVCVDAGNLVKVAVQVRALGIEQIIVAADHDPTGIAGARAVRSSVGAVIWMPEKEGLDWDDVRQLAV